MQVADLREFEEFADIMADIEKLPLYQSALKQFEEGGIPYRYIKQKCNYVIFGFISIRRIID